MSLISIESLTLGDSARRVTLIEALKTWSGFVELCPESTAPSLNGWYDLDERPEAQWSFGGGIAEKLVPALGCHFLQNVELIGDGYLIKDNRFVREKAHTSDVAYTRYCDPHCSTNPINMPRTNLIEIDRPALWISGAGENVYGHWLLDFLPRVVIAQRVLGEHFANLLIVLSSNTSPWVERMLFDYCGVDSSQIQYYHAYEDRLILRNLCIPTFGHDGNYALHEQIRDFYRGLGSVDVKPSRKICISRKTHGGRLFKSRELFESIAIKFGFEIVEPEKLSFAEQATLFGSAVCIVGEHGSALHGSIFSSPGTVVGSIGFNWVQCHVAASCGQQAAFLRRFLEETHAEDGTPIFDVDAADLNEMFVMLGRISISQ